jgi:hypothetical protein
LHQHIKNIVESLLYVAALVERRFLSIGSNTGDGDPTQRSRNRPHLVIDIHSNMSQFSLSLAATHDAPGAMIDRESSSACPFAWKQHRIFEVRTPQLENKDEGNEVT